MTAVLDPLPVRARRFELGGTPALVLGGVVVALAVVAAAWPELLASQAPDAIDPLGALASPSGTHPFGTDQLGRDVYARVVHGARVSLMIGAGATGAAVAVGGLLGVLAAAVGGAVEALIMRVTDVFLALPGLLLALLVVAIVGPGSLNASIAIAVSMMPGLLRVARGQALLVRDSDYVRAAITFGLRRSTVYIRHLVPNALPPVLVLAMVNVGTAIIAGASLSFLGLGPRPPVPEWGAMLAESRDFLDTAWWAAVFPGLAITVTVLAVNVVGRDVQRRLDGRRPGGRR
jgi:peptide/nickel transport system permease protein